MRGVIKTIPVLLVLLGVCILPTRAGSGSVIAQSQGQQSQLQQGQVERVIKGQLVGINPDTNLLTIRLADNSSMDFAYDENTRLVGSQESVQGLSNGQPTIVAVHFTQGDDGRNIATIIEILP